MFRFREWYVPPRMVGGIVRYVSHGVKPGAFLTAVICNDLRAAVETADEENLLNLPAFVAYFAQSVPSAAWGSREKMVAWLERRRDGV